MKEKIILLKESNNLIKVEFCFIIVSTINLLLTSIDGVENAFGDLIFYVKLIVYFFFIFEVLLNVSGSYFEKGIKEVFKYLFSIRGIIDLICAMPFLFIINVNLGFLKLFRLLKVFKVLNIPRYNAGLNMIKNVFINEKEALVVTFLAAILTIIFASSLMYLAEGKIQSDKFGSIPKTLWWAIVTFTTVGYGDSYPITTFGKFIAGIFLLINIGIFAIPTGLISAGVLNELRTRDGERVRITRDE